LGGGKPRPNAVPLAATLYHLFRRLAGVHIIFVVVLRDSFSLCAPGWQTRVQSVKSVCFLARLREGSFTYRHGKLSLSPAIPDCLWRW